MNAGKRASGASAAPESRHTELLYHSSRRSSYIYWTRDVKSRVSLCYILDFWNFCRICSTDPPLLQLSAYFHQQRDTARVGSEYRQNTSRRILKHVHTICRGVVAPPAGSIVAIQLGRTPQRRPCSRLTRRYSDETVSPVSINPASACAWDSRK